MLSKAGTLRRWTPLGVALLFGGALRFWQLGELALIGDESYYWLWSRHLDWAYMDHPAGVAALTWLSTALGGEGEVGIRWLNALLGLACIPLVYLAGRQMLSRPAGGVAALALAAGAPFLLTARFVYTDALQLFLLLINLCWFWRLVSEQPRPRPLTAAAFGLSLALLLNTKYSAYLYCLALGAALLLDHRHLLADRRLWAAGLLAATGLVPVVAWNAAHGWISFRWQLSHAGLSLAGEQGLLGSAFHSLVYLSPPLVALALAGLGVVRHPAGRLLSLVAAFMLLPIILSPANSPRNLSTGLVALLLLAGARWPTRQGERTAGRWWAAVLLTAGLALTALYGLGTVANLSGPSPLPGSSAAGDIRQDAAGWRALGPALAGYPAPIFALDYSIASQITYYSRRPAYTAWGQYRLWGIPTFQDATVVSLAYLPEDLVTARLEDTFRAVEGPERFLFQEFGAVKSVRLWQAKGLRTDQETFLQRFDFLTLLEAAR
jgi:4-amino-4-deoxy-L-arabinose transferase-like glycosyltransferase